MQPGILSLFSSFSSLLHLLSVLTLFSSLSEEIQPALGFVLESDSQALLVMRKGTQYRYLSLVFLLLGFRRVMVARVLGRPGHRLGSLQHCHQEYHPLDLQVGHTLTLSLIHRLHSIDFSKPRGLTCNRHPRAKITPLHLEEQSKIQSFGAAILIYSFSS